MRSDLSPFPDDIGTPDGKCSTLIHFPSVKEQSHIGEKGVCSNLRIQPGSTETGTGAEVVGSSFQTRAEILLIKKIVYCQDVNAKLAKSEAAQSTS